MPRHDPSPEHTLATAQKVLRQYEQCEHAVVSTLLLRHLIARASGSPQIGLLAQAVEWFEQNRPEWGPGTLPTWYADAKDLQTAGNPYATLCTHCYGRHWSPRDAECPGPKLQPSA